MENTSIQKIDYILESSETEKLLSEIKTRMAEEKLKKEKNKTKKTSEKPYTPKDSTWTKLSGLNKEWKDVFTTLSPFVSVYQGRLTPEQILKLLFPFRLEQVDRMEVATKQRYLFEIERGIRLNLRTFRDDIVDGFCAMFEDTYEQNKLKLLMEDKTPNKLLSEEDYVIIENTYVEVLLRLLAYKVGMEDEPLYPFYIQTIEGEFEGYRPIHDLRLRLLKHFDCFYSPVLRDIGERFRYFLEKGNRLTKDEIKEYQKFKVCPATHDLSDISRWDFATIYTGTVGMRILQQHFKLFDAYQTLLTKENLEKIIQLYLDFIQLVFRVDKEKSVATNFDVQNLELIKHMVNRLPEMKEVLLL